MYNTEISCIARTEGGACLKRQPTTSLAARIWEARDCVHTPLQWEDTVRHLLQSAASGWAELPKLRRYSRIASLTMAGHLKASSKLCLWHWLMSLHVRSFGHFKGYGWPLMYPMPSSHPSETAKLSSATKS